MNRQPFFLVFLFLLIPFCVSAQIERGGFPRSFSIKADLSQNIQNYSIKSPDKQQLIDQDQDAASQLKGYRAGIAVTAGIKLSQDATPVKVACGTIRQYSVSCDGALEMGLIFNKIHLPDGADLFVYSTDKQTVAGAFSNQEIHNSDDFTLRPLPGSKLIIEYFEPDHCNDLFEIEISQVIYIYRNGGFYNAKELKSSESGNCEVNINCSEGDDWQAKKAGVVKILTKVGSNFYYCTGTMMNNTAEDFAPLLLTANHCQEDLAGSNASASDLLKWVFYFNFEAKDCSGTSIQQGQSVTGAAVLASSENTGNFGSDFMLLRLVNDIPAHYRPFYCGWDCSSGISSSGVCIHHPDGDIKKISTYTTPLILSTWETTPNTHWLVDWATTVNGRGVTEGGSSGAPLFTKEGLVTGTLSGGESSCNNTLGGDYFGRVAYSWKSNGTQKSQQLQPWLDPANKGTTKMPGSYNDARANADFAADNVVIPVGGKINFQDLSSGHPKSWHWFFEGGTPSESTEQNPVNVTYPSFGSFKVKLIVANEFSSDTLMRRNFIDVRAIISPNPGSGTVNVLADANNSNPMQVEVYNAIGQKLREYSFQGGAQQNSFELPDWGNIFIVRIIQGDQVQSHKVLRVLKK